MGFFSFFIFALFFLLVIALSLFGQVVSFIFKLLGFGRSKSDSKFGPDGFYDSTKDEPGYNEHAEVGKSVKGQKRLQAMKNMAQDVECEVILENK